MIGPARTALTRWTPPWAVVLGGYVLLALLTVGWHALPHPATVCACVGTGDPAAYMWDLVWWPHAILGAHNPFVTHVLWSPTGIDVARNASIPAAAILAAPITALIGPVASYNVLSVAGPPLTAFATYRLCRRLVGSEGPAVVGGLLFGFGAFEFSELTGHLNLTLIPLIPVAVLLGFRRVVGELSRPRYVLYMALLLIVQAGLSTELLVTGVMMGAIAVIGVWLFGDRPLRHRLRGPAIETLGAGAIAMVVLAPFLYYALIAGGFPIEPPGISDTYGLDLLNLVIPTQIQLLGRHDFASLSRSFEVGNPSEAVGYLTVPLIVAFIVWTMRTTRRTLSRTLMFVAGVGLIASLGSHLHIAGQKTVPLPYEWLRDLPLFDAIVPSRFALYVSLALSVGVAAWLAEPGRGSGRRWLVAGLAVALLIPNITSRLWGRAPSNPRFFAAGLHRRYLARDESVLILPYDANDTSTLWQAEADFSFVMPGGYIGVVPPPFARDPVVGALVANTPPPSPAFGSFIRDHRVRDVVVDAAAAGPWPAAMAALGFHRIDVGGVILYRVPPVAPG